MGRFDGGASYYPDTKRTSVIFNVIPVPTCSYLKFEFLSFFHLHQSDKTICKDSGKKNDYLELKNKDTNVVEERICGMQATPFERYYFDGVKRGLKWFKSGNKGKAGFKCRICSFGGNCDPFTSSTTTCRFLSRRIPLMMLFLLRT